MIIKLENGNEIECEVITKLENPKTNQKYLVYRPLDEEDIYAGRIDDKLNLSEITEDSEWDFIDEKLSEIGD